MVRLSNAHSFPRPLLASLPQVLRLVAGSSGHVDRVDSDRPIKGASLFMFVATRCALAWPHPALTRQPTTTTRQDENWFALIFAVIFQELFRYL